MYWEKENECMSRDELEQFQFEKLESTLNRVHMNVPFYRKKFDELGIDTDEIRTMDDFRKLPFTTKDDLRDNYPYGLFAVSLREVVRIHASSGTTGMSTVVGYTRNDIKIWSNLVARIMTAGGVTRDDLVQIAFGYGLFTGGFGLHYGAERLGASVIPISSGNTKRQIRIMQDFRTTTLICTPSYAMLIADTIYEMGININALSLKYGLFGAEPWSESMRQEIQEKLRIVATDNYGLSEVMGPGVAGECLERNGLHINEDHFLVEVIKPDTLEPVAPGEVGELVVTTLTKEAFPVIRFRTRDLTRLITEPCPCGRTFVRMSRVMGRTDDMLIIRGVNVFPSQIESILFDIEGTEPHYQIVVERDDALDRATVLVEVSEAIFFDEMKKQSEMVGLIRKRLASELGISVEVRLVEKKTLERFEGKAKRVIDKRNL
ncbi:phenylacetate-coenzyme A ligase [bacterium BMS3Abin07]|nr:phenylacetate-coenzyme A ligase [bacterium BMS3Abin07]GBE31425.1 phenylacetate-coenzyme A ligase [bacterium BMS3Bbin05]HDL21254.1 phenylacetate--CoA ligase family protein [Nitrospirota bacterium]HDO22182.1 phenylacetate--CoA ligase family protein [Nitrospirota bacterium]HDZ87348.1 phenylacetate--CoA ligase family protein [Nitrospirota bacterium]